MNAPSSPYLDSNLAALDAIGTTPAQRLAGALRHAVPDAATGCQLLKTEAGDYTLLLEGQPLHSPYGAQQEAAALIAALARPAPGRLHVVVGLGLGYLPDALLSESPGTVLVYEPDFTLLAWVFANVDLAPMLETGRLMVATTLREVGDAVRQTIHAADDVDVLILPAEGGRFAESLSAFSQTLETAVLDRLRDIRTHHHFQELWVENIAILLDYLPGIAPMESLCLPARSDETVFVVSSGPSLDAALETIARYRGKTRLIAAGSALRRLAATGIVPDIALFCDARVMMPQISGLSDEYLRQIIFAGAAGVEGEIWNAPCRAQVLLCADNRPEMADWLDATLAIRHRRLGGGGSVSIFAVQLALAMGFGRIALCGQDLAFTGGHAYAGGIPAEYDASGQLIIPQSVGISGTLTVEMIAGQQGEPLPTLKAYAGFARHLEDIAAENPERELCNTSLGGAALAGYDLIPAEDLATRWGLANRPDLPTLPSPEMALLPSRTAQLSQAIDTLRSECDQLAALCQQAHAQPQDAAATLATLVNRVARDPLIAFAANPVMADFRKALKSSGTIEGALAGRPDFFPNLAARLTPLHQVNSASQE